MTTIHNVTPELLAKTLWETQYRMKGSTWEELIEWERQLENSDKMFSKGYSDTVANFRAQGQRMFDALTGGS
jgi:hypothetical protein